MKICTRCKLDKQLSEFNKNATKPDGLQTICRICSNNRSRRYYAENTEKHKAAISRRKVKYISETQKFIWEHLLAHPCIDCGETNILVLEFDHVRGEKKYNVSEMIWRGLSIDSIRHEINKCDVRCANCHSIKTAIEQRYSIVEFYAGR